MQGQIRKSFLEVEIDTRCAQTGRAMKFVVDSELNHRIVEGGDAPLVFEPDVDWKKFKDPNIIDGY